MANLKRLSGAKEVVQDDYAQGVGTYVVSFGENPKVKVVLTIWGRPVDVDVEYWQVEQV